MRLLELGRWWGWKREHGFSFFFAFLSFFFSFFFFPSVKRGRTDGPKARRDMTVQIHIYDISVQ